MITLYKYLAFSLSIVFISWIAGMLVNAFLAKTAFYNKRLSNLNFLKKERANKLIGIDLTKWVVKNTFFKFFNPYLKMKNKSNLSDLVKLRQQMTKAEIDHLIAFIFVTFFAVFKAIEDHYLRPLQGRNE